ncbi:hypothetical protein [Sandaracinus amylolyticus]|uniref:Uncharacterized protein n=1 Tax=Sandaracinus amylolyticus TaxID=927083 RepID=A0A0F6W5L1_9BACT|nr:hypothetical protein [Sandaracinus amylolyticus]AKF08068.1 hypothetical protein DB32_005217 [Sandaracinus amylolyticus]
MFTTWYAASDELVDVLLEGVGEPEPAYLDGIAELELIELGELLDAPYQPAPVRTDGSLVLRINAPFLAALARVDDLDALAVQWRERAPQLVELEIEQIVETLGEMQRAAREGLAGPGVLSMPAE